MLVPTINVVALSVPVAVSEITGVGGIVTDGIVGIGIEAESLSVGVADAVGITEATGAVLEVAFPETGGVMMTLLDGAVDRVEAGCSDAGTLRDWLSEAVGTGTAEEPTEPDGRMEPEGRTPSLADGIAEPEAEIPALADGVTMGVALSVGRTILAVSEGVGTRPDDDSTSEETAPVGTVPEGATTPDDGRTPGVG